MRPAFIDRQNQANSRGIYLGPIQVYSDDQVAQYEAQGYQVCTVPDPRNYHVEYGAGAPPVTYVHSDYPMWVTPEKLVQNEAEHKAWLATVPEAPGEAPAEAVVAAEPEAVPVAAAPAGDLAKKRARDAQRQRRARLKAAQQAA